MSRRTDDRGAGSLFEASAPMRPLASRMRPTELDEFMGQDELLGKGQPLRAAIESGSTGSIILWGPPGSGKTTLARIIARRSGMNFEPFSAVSEGVPRIRQIAADALERRASGAGGTVLFIDEIHRLNKAQQDSLLPYVEEGVLVLIGATTEAPSFEINSALLSRVRVFVLDPLTPEVIRVVLDRALKDADRGLASAGVAADEEALDFIARTADGDARRALTVLDAAANQAGAGGRIDVKVAEDALQMRFALHDKSGEAHFNLLSAYHKSLRGSDPQAALYWMARMVTGGEDPMVIFRRAIAMAAEDIGLADPEALKLAVAAREAFRTLGSPEGLLPLAEITIYLASAPKSNASYKALSSAMQRAAETPGAPVPLNIRNAPTGLHASLGYHQGYKYAHDSPDAYVAQDYLPPELEGSVFYEPGTRGFEREIARRLEWWRQLREQQIQSSGDRKP
jgi:putative ATPase